MIHLFSLPFLSPTKTSHGKHKRARRSEQEPSRTRSCVQIVVVYKKLALASPALNFSRRFAPHFASRAKNSPPPFVLTKVRRKVRRQARGRNSGALRRNSGDPPRQRLRPIKPPCARGTSTPAPAAGPTSAWLRQEKPPWPSARATDCARKRAFGNRIAAWPKLAPDQLFGYI